MNLFSGLEQFGFKPDKNKTELYADDKKEKKKTEVKPKLQRELEEHEFLFTKKIRCTVCQKVFDTKMVKNARIKRLQPDFDLRPNFENIDTLKYDVSSCPFCGYSAMNRYFEHLTKGQINLVKENICINFISSKEPEPETFDYDQAIARYKLALYNSVVKRAKTSEKAYTCLKISWLYRSKLEELGEGSPEEKAAKEECQKAQEEFYKEAYDGFQKALASEDFPMCGMDTFTMDYMMAAMSMHFKEYSYASKSLSNIITSQIADRRIKDKALELKEQVVAQIRKESQ